LDNGLRLLHPLMPFLTEELWHRLPGWAQVYGEATPSIMTAAYPRPVPTHRNIGLEERMDSVLQIVHAIRSVKGSYNLTPRQKTDVVVVFTENASSSSSSSSAPAGIATDVASLTEFISFLAAAGTITVLQNGGEKPAGSSSIVLSPTISVHVVLKGLINVELETKKQSKKVDELNKQLENLRKQTTIPNYEEKVPENIRQQTAEKIAEREAELDILQQTLKNLKQME